MVAKCCGGIDLKKKKTSLMLHLELSKMTLREEAQIAKKLLKHNLTNQYTCKDSTT